MCGSACYNLVAHLHEKMKIREAILVVFGSEYVARTYIYNNHVTFCVPNNYMLIALDWIRCLYVPLYLYLRLFSGS